MIRKLKILYYYLKYKYGPVRRSRAYVEKRQAKKVERHLRRVTETIPFYRPYRGAALDDLPVMDKVRFMDHFDQLNAGGITEKEALDFAAAGERARDFRARLGKVTVGLSSGTSGRRGAFLVSDQESAMWAGYVLARFLPEGILKPCRIAFFMRANSNLYEAVGSGRIQFRFFDILKELEGQLPDLERLVPDVLVGQPSVLLALAAEKAAGRLAIAPRRVISVAEVLEERDAERLKDAFGVSVIHQAYQCMEGCLALTCSHGNLHLNEDIVFFEKEYLDDSRFVPMVTDFTRRTQPVLRYRLNDILQEDRTPCPCGCHFTRLARIEGREDDVFLFPGIRGGEVRVFPDFIRRCVLFAGELGDYRVVQGKEGELTVYSDAPEEGRARLREELQGLAVEMGFWLPTVVFSPYQTPKGRKMKRIERLQGGYDQ